MTRYERCVLCIPISDQSLQPCTWGFLPSSSRIFKDAKGLVGCLSAICHVFFTADNEFPCDLIRNIDIPG